MELENKENYLLYTETKLEDYIFSYLLKLFPYEEMSFDYSEFNKKTQGISSRYACLKAIKIDLFR